HIPSDGEFTELTDFLGGVGVAGGKMKEAGYEHWNSPNTGGTNSSGFTFLPGGYRYSFFFTGFENEGETGYLWSASESGSNYWIRELNYDGGDVLRYTDSRLYGFSARCVRD
ncbi:MAG: FISUMP domain-containing protein, partial [Flavobacteriales bacterium]|nr:FISUMP domain-containing protein [Flavobacteriales bacterium]